MGADASAPTLDQLAVACPSEFAACEAAAGCEDALMVALSGGEPDASGPGVAELQALVTCLNGQSGGSGGPDSCRYAFDHECDDGSQGGPQYCATGTDTTDCAETQADASAPTLDQLAVACPSEFAACEAAAGCEDALMVALSGGEPD